MPEYNPLINQVILLVISIGLPLLLRWLLDDVVVAAVAYYKSKVDTNTQAVIEDIVYTAVQAAEQMGMTGELKRMGLEKLQYALDYADAELCRHGIDLDMQAIRAMIEAQVKQVFNTPRGQG